MSIRFVAADNFAEQLDEYSRLIASRAYERYERRGLEEGHELEDWCVAEKEVGRLVPVGIFERREELEINVRLLGCQSQEIEACLEQDRLLVRAQKGPENLESARSEVQAGRHFDGIFLALDLPERIDPSKARVKFENGDLCLTLPKAIVH